MGRRLGIRHLFDVGVHAAMWRRERISKPKGFRRAECGYCGCMTNPQDTSNPSEDDRQEAGAREQGVRSEDSRDRSSPQLTTDADKPEPRTPAGEPPPAP